MVVQSAIAMTNQSRQLVTSVASGQVNDQKQVMIVAQVQLDLLVHAQVQADQLPADQQVTVPEQIDHQLAVHAVMGKSAHVLIAKHQIAHAAMTIAVAGMIAHVVVVLIVLVVALLIAMNVQPVMFQKSA